MNLHENPVLSVGTEHLKFHPGMCSYGYPRAPILGANFILFMLRQNSDTFGWSRIKLSAASLLLQKASKIISSLISVVPTSAY